MNTGPARWLLRGLVVLLIVLLAACAGKSVKTAPEPADGPSSRPLTAAQVKDAVPRVEALSRYGNHSPYEVFGKKYQVMASSRGYVQRGTASWYGSKFHGRRTSSGEPYDMHLATAAHKTLPLPTYAEVTNLDNGKKVIVKINDRGPFKDNRIIDLSYAAALRLGVIATGTAPVEVRAIDPSSLRYASASPQPVRPAASDETEGTWLQAGAYGQRAGAEELVRKLTTANFKPVSINTSGKLFRVWLGPYFSHTQINAVMQRAIELGFERPHTVKH